MSFVGNKGEWSEFYAFVKLLATGRLYAADKNLNAIENSYFPIFKIIRNQNSKHDTEYIIRANDETVEIHCDNNVIDRISQKDLNDIASYLYENIIAKQNRSFEIKNAQQIMQKLNCTKISASSSDKTDITLQIREIYTSTNPKRCFSIKSELGSAPTLLNASNATNFVFEIKGLDKAKAKNINDISSNTKIKDRINKINESGQLNFKLTKNQNFASNLTMVDSWMNEIIAYMLKDYYLHGISDCKSLIKRIEEKNPLGYKRSGFYEYKFKKLLSSFALDMMPSKIWNGKDESNGGYIIVKKDGDIVAYHIYNRDNFETYLLNSTKFDTASSTRHNFASIYNDSDNTMCIDLNLQIRFI